MKFLKKFWYWVLVIFGFSAASAAYFGGTPIDIEKIQAFENDYFSQYGEYAQILPDKKLPSDIPQSILNFSTAKPFVVDSHGYPDGTKGYTIRWIEEPIHDSDIASSTPL